MFNWATSSHEPATRTIAGRFVFFVCADHRFSPETRTDQLIRPVKCNVIDNFAALIIIFERQLSVEKTNYKLIITRTQAFARASCNENSWWAEWRGWLLFNWKVVKLNLCIFFLFGSVGFRRRYDDNRLVHRKRLHCSRQQPPIMDTAHAAQYFSGRSQWTPISALSCYPQLSLIIMTFLRQISKQRIFEVHFSPVSRPVFITRHKTHYTINNEVGPGAVRWRGGAQADIHERPLDAVQLRLDGLRHGLLHELDDTASGVLGYDVLGCCVGCCDVRGESEHTLTSKRGGCQNRGCDYLFVFCVLWIKLEQ